MATKTKYASRADVKAEATKMSGEFLACRDVGHTWRQSRVVKVRGGFNRDLFCPTCKTGRHEFITRSGEKLSVTYTYPEGYQLRGLGRLLGDSRNALRLESVVRAMDSALGEGKASFDLTNADGAPSVTPVPTVTTEVLNQEEVDA